MKKILIIGDSTLQWIRPYRNHNDELTYTELLLEKYNVNVVSKPGMTSRDVLQYYWNHIGGNFYDIYIISVGINDLTPRSYPRWLWKINNNIVLPLNRFEKSIDFLYKIITYPKIQTFFSKTGLSKPWISPNSFKLYLLKLQEIILKESDSKMIFLSLPMVSQRIKNILPSIEKNVIDFKKIFTELSEERSTILDIDTLFQDNMNLYNPEGIHYSADGHKKIFEALLEIIEMGKK